MCEYPPLSADQIAAIPTLVDCRCRARVHGDGSGIEIDYCELHADAPRLLRRAVALLRRMRPHPPDEAEYRAVLDEAAKIA